MEAEMLLIIWKRYYLSKCNLKLIMSLTMAWNKEKTNDVHSIITWLIPISFQVNLIQRCSYRTIEDAAITNTAWFSCNFGQHWWLLSSLYHRSLWSATAWKVDPPQNKVNYKCYIPWGKSRHSDTKQPTSYFRGEEVEQKVSIDYHHQGCHKPCNHLHRK